MSRKSDLSRQLVAEHEIAQTAAHAIAALSLKINQDADVEHDHAVRRAETEFTAAIDKVSSDAADSARKADKEYTAAIAQVAADLENARRKAVNMVTSALSGAGPSVLPWSAPAWQTLAPPANGQPPSMVRVGELIQKSGPFSLPAIPALLPLVGNSGKHLLVSFDEEHSSIAAALIESVAWRIAALSPPASYRFLLLDPLDSGTNLASLLRLPEELRGNKIYWGDTEIEEALKGVAADMEDVLQRRLLNKYSNIEEYNARNPQVAVPYTFVVIAGFPKRFTSRAADLLYSIARSGQRAGCYLVGGLLRGGSPPHGFDLQGFIRMSTYVSLKSAQLAEWTDPVYGPTAARIDAAPSAGQVDHLAGAIEPLVAASQSQSVPFQQIAVRKANWWQANNGDGLAACIGLDHRGELYRLQIGGGGGSPQHALVGGTTNMGKTNLLHLLVLSLATAYSPQDLEFYLVDFKGGVEFQDYATHDLAHVRAVVLEAEREFGLSVLQRLEEEMEWRATAFKSAGISSIDEYRRKSGQPMKRILLIIDEYVVLFSEDDSVAQRASESLGALVMRGRAFGIHVLLSAQRPASSFLSMTSIKSQMGLRIALKCRPDDSTLILGEGNELAARLQRAGETYITSDPDRVTASVLVRTARVSPDDRTLYLRGLKEFARLKQCTRSEPMIVFNRDAPTLWAEAQPTTEALAAQTAMQVGSPPISLSYPPASGASTRFWLGQPLRIAPDVEVEINTEQGANLFILGPSEALAHRLLLCAILGIALTVPPKGAGSGRFLFIGTPETQRNPSGQFAALRATLPHRIDLSTRREAVDALGELVREVEARVDSTGDDSPHERIFVVVAGLHRWTEARSSESYLPSAAGKHITYLAQQGPAVGVHLLVWADRTTTLAQAVSSGALQETLSQFTHRVAMHTTGDESFNFLGVPHASKLLGDRALYRSEYWPTEVLEKFKPYTLPTHDELRSLLGGLGANGVGDVAALALPEVG